MSRPTPDYDKPCDLCGRPIGDHTLREHGQELREHGLDFVIPHAEVEGGPVIFPGLDGKPAGALTVASAFVGTDLGKLPALRFQFVGVTENPAQPAPMEPIWLILDVEAMRTISQLVATAVDHAILASVEGE